MRKFVFAAIALAISGSPVQAQSIAELKAQYAQTMEMLNQAEAAGMDAAMVASLRESLEALRQSIEEDERAQSEAAQAPVEEAPPPAPAPAAAEPNLAASPCADFGVTEDNYRQASIAPGNDLQMRTLCGHALELYSMYKRALSQGHPEAGRTYDAHRQASMQLTGFDRETRAAPGGGITPDTKTAVQVETERREAAAQALADAPPAPPKAPPCKGCVTPQ
jgi:hypothetical protein